MAAIASSWSSAGATATLSLCEDLAAELGDPCEYVHQVRGGGRGRRHEDNNSSTGCSDCALSTAAAVRGTLSSESLGGTVEVAGTIYLGSHGDEPYDFPYSVELYCVAGTCYMSGTLNEDGSLEIGIGIGTRVEPVTLARTGAAACP